MGLIVPISLPSHPPLSSPINAGQLNAGQLNAVELIGMERASPPHKKNNKKHHPLKVVHISNPMKVTASAATFRAIVQELTGRDSVIADVLARQPAFDSDPPRHPAQPRAALLPRLQPPEHAVAADAGNSFMWAAERFGSMEEYFAGLLPPAPLLQSPLFFDGDD